MNKDRHGRNRSLVPISLEREIAFGKRNSDEKLEEEMDGICYKVMVKWTMKE